MNRLLSILFAILLYCGVAFGTVTKVDSIPNFLNAVYRGGDLFKIGVLTDYYGIIFTSETGANRVTVATFSCTDAGVLPAAIIDSQVFTSGSDGTNVGRHSAAIQIKDTNYFIGSWSFNGTADSTWVFIFGIDTADATFDGAGVIDDAAIKWDAVQDQNLIQIGTSDYYAFSYRSQTVSNCYIKTFLVDPATPAILDVTVDSATVSAYSTDIDQLGTSDYYVVSAWGANFVVATFPISQVDGTIGAQVDAITVAVGGQAQTTRFETDNVNDSVFVAASYSIAGAYPRYLHSFVASPYDGDLTAGDSEAIATKCACLSVAANDSGAIVFYSDYWTNYDGYLAAYSINQATGTFTKTQQSEIQWSENLTSDDSFFSSMMLTENSRYVLLAYRTATPYYGFLRTMLLEPTPYWAHERDGIAYPNLNSVSGVGISSVIEVSGTVK